jgi:hypothetical protein
MTKAVQLGLENHKKHFFLKKINLNQKKEMVI